MRAAVINNGVVDNIIIVNSLSDAPGLVAADDTAAIGDSYANGVFTKPYTPPLIPSVVTMRQARLALLAAGRLPTVNSAIAAMAGTDGDAARIEWEYAATVSRNSPLVSNLAGALALSAAQLDTLFTAAAAL